MKYIFAALLFAALSTTPSQARTPGEGVRAGDRAMTCPAIAADIASLTTREPVAPKRGRRLLKMLGGAASLLPGVAIVRSTVMATVASIAQTELAKSAVPKAPPPVISADDASLSARRERLTALFDEKGC